MPKSQREAVIALAASLLFALLTLASLRNGIRIDAEGWAHWQAAVALAQGEGFVDFTGASLRHWAPGFALFLLPAQALSDGAAAGLVASIVFAAIIAGWGWALCVLRSASAAAADAPPIAMMLAPAALFVVSLSAELSSTPLLLALVPFGLLAVRAARAGRTPREIRGALLRLSIALAALVAVADAAMLLSVIVGVAVARSGAVRHASLSSLSIASSILLPLLVWGAESFGLGRSLEDFAAGVFGRDGIGLAIAGMLALFTLSWPRLAELASPGLRVSRFSILRRWEPGLTALALLGLSLLLALHPAAPAQVEELQPPRRDVVGLRTHIVRLCAPGPLRSGDRWLIGPPCLD